MKLDTGLSIWKNRWQGIAYALVSAALFGASTPLAKALLGDISPWMLAGLAQRGKTSMGWFFGFKLHLVFNNDHEIVALKLTPGNVHDTTPVPALTRELTGKLFGDKGYIGQKLAEDLLRRGLTLFTRVRRNMKSLPMSLHDKALLNARNMAETIIGHIKEFSSLNLSKHRSVINAFVHIIAAITAYQINPFKPKPKRNLQPCYRLQTTA